LSIEDSRVYPGYHPRNEGKYSGVFPRLSNLEKKIRKKCFSFLWTGKREVEGIPLVKWSMIAKPKEARG